jgi:glycosyltransferase involved in cell wall biosynthesis
MKKINNISEFDLSIIVPCYNEAENLQFLFPKILEISKNIKIKIEIILVDNGSSDNTFVKILDFQKKTNNKIKIEVLKINKNEGYGNGILSGLKIAKGELLSWTHADYQTELNDVIRAYNIYNLNFKKNKNFLIKGKRGKRPFSDILFTKFMSIFIFFISGKRFTDINAQPKFFHKNFLKLIVKAPKDFLLDFYVLDLALRNKFQIKDFDVSFRKRAFGKSKGGGSLIGKIRLSIRSLIYIMKYYHGNHNT